MLGRKLHHQQRTVVDEHAVGAGDDPAVRVGRPKVGCGREVEDQVLKLEAELNQVRITAGVQGGAGQVQGGAGQDRLFRQRAGPDPARGQLARVFRPSGAEERVAVLEVQAEVGVGEGERAVAYVRQGGVGGQQSDGDFESAQTLPGAAAIVDGEDGGFPGTALVAVSGIEQAAGGRLLRRARAVDRVWRRRCRRLAGGRRWEPLQVGWAKVEVADGGGEERFGAGVAGYGLPGQAVRKHRVSHREGFTPKRREQGLGAVEHGEVAGADAEAGDDLPFAAVERGGSDADGERGGLWCRLGEEGVVAAGRTEAEVAQDEPVFGGIVPGAAVNNPARGLVGRRLERPAEHEPRHAERAVEGGEDGIRRLETPEQVAIQPHRKGRRCAGLELEAPGQDVAERGRCGGEGCGRGRGGLVLHEPLEQHGFGRGGPGLPGCAGERDRPGGARGVMGEDEPEGEAGTCTVVYAPNDDDPAERVGAVRLLRRLHVEGSAGPERAGGEEPVSDTSELQRPDSPVRC